jgi:hypothetical protein
MTDDDRAAAETAAFITAASMKQPASNRVKRTATLDGKALQLMVPDSTRAATMNEQQLGRALKGARDEQQRKALLQAVRPPTLGTPKGGEATTESGGRSEMEVDGQPDMDGDPGFELYE